MNKGNHRWGRSVAALIMGTALLTSQLQTFTYAASGSLDGKNYISSENVTVRAGNSRPAGGVTTGNPFPKGTGGSNSFRIPALITMGDGSIVAAADARWNTTYDGGGLDTIVSRSTDNGVNWSYTFANYLGDNGDVYNGAGSTTFIDPALATDGKALYMLCDIYPYGVALNGNGNTQPTNETGFNAEGRLALKKSGEYAYSYYLDGNIIRDSSGAEVPGYTVDPWFNITGNGADTNLFFKDAPFQVMRTSYLYFTSSEDGGKNWSEPKLINVKTTGEKAYLAAPGRGIVTKDGKIVFSCYGFNGSDAQQRMDFICSADGGQTWNRISGGTAHWSSESAAVELNDGTLRFFYRNGNSSLHYIDYKDGKWLGAVNTNIATNSNCQISAIKYSKTVQGRQVLMISCPTGPDGNGSNVSTGGPYSQGGHRLNGKIFVGLVNSDNSMDWNSGADITVNQGNAEYMYSCLTEMQDGRIALLYEDHQNAWGAGSDNYYTMDFKTYDVALPFDRELNIIEQPVDARSAYGYSSQPGISVKVDLDAGSTYSWYQVLEDGTENLVKTGTESFFSLPFGEPCGTYSYYCKIANGYSTKRSDTAKITVEKATPKVEVTAEKEGDKAVKLTANVGYGGVPAAGGSLAVPSGSVTFYAGDKDISGERPTVDGTAVFVWEPPFGSHTVKADYKPAANESNYTSVNATDSIGAEVAGALSKLTGITPPAPLSVANGIAYDAMGLPSAIAISVEGGAGVMADVVWDTATPAAGSYDPAISDRDQTVTLNGAVICPADIDPNGIDLTVQISITIRAAGIVGTPTADVAAGSYTDNQLVSLHSTTAGASIYYTLDGSEPDASNGTLFVPGTPIQVTGKAGVSVPTVLKAIAVMDGIQSSNVASFEYIVSLPAVHAHLWDTAWTSDGTYHWHACTAPGCDGSSEGKTEHTESSWFTEKQPSTAEDGVKYTECTVCGRRMRSEMIPKMGGAVTVEGALTPQQKAPSVTVQPQNTSVKVGGNATFAIAADGTMPLAYQWKIDRNNGSGWVDLSNAVGARYTTSRVDESCSGFRYKCVVTNGQGSVESSEAVLTVIKDGTERQEQIEQKYVILEGEGQEIETNYGGTVTIRAAGEFSKFEGVTVDGKTVPRKYYTAKSGSTILTINKEYLDTLSVGKHTVRMNYTDGYAETSLHVKEDENLTENAVDEPGEKATEQPTGEMTPDRTDSSEMIMEENKTEVSTKGDMAITGILVAIVLLFGGGGIIFMTVRKKKCREDE